MVSEKKVKAVQELKKELKGWPVIGVIDFYKLPARQLFQIKQKLRGKAVIRMVKKRLIIRALEEAGLTGLKDLEKHVHGSPALLLSKEDPFALARIIEKSKSGAPAKPGDIAPHDIMIPAGPTSLSAGPAIGELQKAKLPVGVEDGKIAVKKDTVIAREGEEIPKLISDVMAKLGIEPMEIGLDLKAVWESGTIYQKDILFIPVEKYLEDIQAAHSNALSLTLSINYLTKENVPLLLGKAHREAVSLALEAGVLTKETLEPLLARADAQAHAVKALVKEPPKEEPKPEEKKEEKPEEKKEEKKEEKQEPKEEKKEESS